MPWSLRCPGRQHQDRKTDGVPTPPPIPEFYGYLSDSFDRQFSRIRLATRQNRRHGVDERTAVRRKVSTRPRT